MTKLVVACAIALCCAIATAQDFKIETMIYAGDDKEPVSQNVTLFQGNLVFDLKLDQATPPHVLETRIYDSRLRAVSLLDLNRKVQVELTDHRLLQLVESLRKEVAENSELAFLVNEAFTETTDVTGNTVELSSSTFKYKISGQRPPNASYLTSYTDFLDTFTRLSASHPGGFPPFARLRLNEAIKKVGWLPSKVDLVMQPNALITKGLKMSSTHTLIDGLSTLDQERIRNARGEWLAFKRVDLLTFRGVNKTAAATTKPTQKK